MKQRLGLAIVLFCLMPALFAQQKAKQNAREDNASFMFTESQLNEDDDAEETAELLKDLFPDFSYVRRKRKPKKE